MVFLGCIFSEVIVSYNRSAANVSGILQLLTFIYWRLSPQFFMDKSIINRDEPCSAM
jgi:hypothetical protein